MRQRLFSIFYSFILFIIFLVMLPKMLYQRIVYKKYKNNFLLRLGIGYPTIQKKEGSFLIWIHAVSMGEMKAVTPLVKQLKKEYENSTIIVSSITKTGFKEAQRNLSFVDHHVYLPFDFKWIIKRLFKTLSIDLILFCETDFWYHFLNEAKKKKTKTILVNGKLSERSYKRFSNFSFFARRIFGLFDFFCVQNQLYKKRFIALNIPSDKIIVSGNLKLDQEDSQTPSKDLEDLKTFLGIKSFEKVLVIGSTHDPEEQEILTIIERSWVRFPQLKVILVPRHPERFSAVAQLLKRKEISFTRYTDSKNRLGNEKVVLVDAMGLLRQCYQIADVAIVGGSFIPKIGGHNILEPCFYGVPVLYGPFMFSQKEFVDLCQSYRAGDQVALNHLGDALEDLLTDHEKRKIKGLAGLQMIKESQGSLDKTMKALRILIENEKS